MEYKTPKEVADFCKDEKNKMLFYIGEENRIKPYKTATFIFDQSLEGISITKQNNGFEIVDLLGMIEILKNQLIMESEYGKG